VILGELEGSEKDTVVAFLRSIPLRLLKTIRTVCSDMNEGFTEAIREEVKSTQLLIDRFDVTRKCLDGLYGLRKQPPKRLTGELTQEVYAQLKGSL
jgi:transposase